VEQKVKVFYVSSAEISQCVDAAFDNMQVRQVVQCEDRSLETEQDTENQAALNSRKHEVTCTWPLTDILEGIQGAQLYETGLDVKVNPLENKGASDTSNVFQILSNALANMVMKQAVAKNLVNEEETAKAADGPFHGAIQEDTDTRTHPPKNNVANQYLHKLSTSLPGRARNLYYNEDDTDIDYDRPRKSTVSQDQDTRIPPQISDANFISANQIQCLIRNLPTSGASGVIASNLYYNEDETDIVLERPLNSTALQDPDRGNPLQISGTNANVTSGD